MKPFARIRQGSRDITAALGSRLLSVEVFDEADDKSDRVSIELDTSPQDGFSIDVPHVGTTVSIEIGYAGGAAADLGTYKIDGLRESKPPRTLTITGRSADMPSSFRTPRSESYHQETLGSILGEVAERNGLESVIDPELSSIVIRHADQKAESDMAFASRIAGEYDGVARPVSGRLVVARRGVGAAATGEALPVVRIIETDCIRWDFDYNARDEAGEAEGLPAMADDERGEPATEGKGGVRAYWTDIATGRREEVEVGREPFHELRYTYHNEAEAVAAASAYRNRASRGKATFGCEIGGRPSVQAEASASLAGFPSYIPSLWRIKTASHRFDGGGYVTRIQCELFEPRQEAIPGNVGGSKPGRDDTIDEDAPSGAIQTPSSGANNRSEGALIGDEEYIIRPPT